MNTTPDYAQLLFSIAQHSDQRAYRQLFDHFYPSLFQFAITYLKNSQQAEEAVSDVFIKIWKKRSGLHRIRNIKLYLFVSTKNTALNYLRLQNKPAIQAEDYKVQMQSIYFDPEQLLITEEMHRRLQLAISQLPPRCQLIFKLVREDGLKYREVADLLQLSIKTVENQMSAALSKLGQAISFDIHSASLSAR